MTKWVEVTAGGVGRDPVSLARAWVAVVTRPRVFFAEAVRPGDQAPGLLFAVGIAAVAAATRILADPSILPDAGPRPVVGALVVGLVALLLAPLVLHLTAAVETVALMLLVDDRAGVSETVQTLGYATAPLAFAGVPVPALRLVCVVHGAALLAVGTAVVHDVSVPVAVAATVVPSALAFGVVAGGFEAGEAVVEALGAVGDGTPLVAAPLSERSQETISAPAIPRSPAVE